MTDDNTEEGMSQAVALIYRALFDELRFLKQQQWTTTNYLVLVLAAIFGIARAFEHLTTNEKIMGTVLAVSAGTYGIAILITIQRDMGERRIRLNEIGRAENNFFNQKERIILKLVADKRSYLRGILFLIALIGVSAIGCALVIYSLWR